MPLGAQIWQNTRLEMPKQTAGELRNWFTGEPVASAGSFVRLADALESFPIALLVP
jgi:maltooligosyltrehalose synthase